MLKRLFLALLLLALLAGGLLVVAVTLALQGGPRACGSGDQGGVGAADLRAAVDDLRRIRSLDRRVTYSERVVTRLARDYVAGQGYDVDNLKVGFCNGRAEASGTWGRLGIDGRVTADLGVENGRVRYQVREARVGALPAWAATWLARRALDRAAVEQIDLGLDVSEIRIGNGTVTLISR